MLQAKSFLAVDFGAGSLKLVEFEQNEAGGLRLKQYAYKSLGREGSQEATRESAVLKALQQLLTEKQFVARTVNVCAPGFHVFTKFIKLPPVDSSKVPQIIQYEAQQNVPFPLDEVVWDYQILGANAAGDLEVLLVAIKSDVVEGLFRTSESAGLRLQLVDVSTAALYNAFRYNYGDLEGSTMLLDIGAKTSNLLFFEKGKVFARSINIGSNAITQEFSTESRMAWDQAEQFKTEYGFVSLGGAYEEPDDPHQAQVSKIARQVLTRLHIQINQTMQVYKGQQGGTPPVRLFLSGGGSILPYTAQFFSEKLNLPVEYFNPLRNVEFDPALDLEDLSKYAHALGETVGLALRNLANCPVELNLVPKSVLGRQQFNQKKPYFIAAIFSLVLVFFATGFVFQKVADKREAQLDRIKQQMVPLSNRKAELDRLEEDIKKATNEVNTVAGWVYGRFVWADILNDLRNVMIATEKAAQAGDGKGKVGVWLETFTPVEPASTPTTADSAKSAAAGRGERGSGGGRSKEGSSKAPPASSGEITTIQIKCRVAPENRGQDVYPIFADEINKSGLFTGTVRSFSNDASTDTYHFTAELKLKRGVKQ